MVSPPLPYWSLSYIPYIVRSIESQPRLSSLAGERGYNRERGSTSPAYCTRYWVHAWLKRKRHIIAAFWNLFCLKRSVVHTMYGSISIAYVQYVSQPTHTEDGTGHSLLHTAQRHFYCTIRPSTVLFQHLYSYTHVHMYFTILYTIRTSYSCTTITASNSTRHSWINGHKLLIKHLHSWPGTQHFDMRVHGTPDTRR